MIVRAVLRLLALLLGAAASGGALAHANGSSYLRIDSGDAGAVTATWDIPAQICSFRWSSMRTATVF